MMCGYGFSGWTWGAMLIMIVLMIALAVGLIWALVHWLNRKARLPAPHESSSLEYEPSSLEVLQQRYAHGEIDTATFENMRERLIASGVRSDFH